MHDAGRMCGGQHAFKRVGLLVTLQIGVYGTPASSFYALGAEIGPIAICYRTSLMAEASLPTSPRVLARDFAAGQCQPERLGVRLLQ
jgi:hypothetical protein